MNKFHEALERERVRQDGFLTSSRPASLDAYGLAAIGIFILVLLGWLI